MRGEWDLQEAREKAGTACGHHCVLGHMCMLMS